MTRVLLWLIAKLTPAPEKITDFANIGPECFGVGWDVQGYPSHICYKGETYTPKPLTRRTSLHNYLIGRVNARTMQ